MNGRYVNSFRSRLHGHPPGHNLQRRLNMRGGTTRLCRQAYTQAATPRVMRNKGPNIFLYTQQHVLATSSCAYRYGYMNAYPIQRLFLSQHSLKVRETAIFITLSYQLASRGCGQDGMRMMAVIPTRSSHSETRACGMHRDHHLHFFSLAIVIEFITTHFITPAVIVVGRKDIGIGKMVIECHLQGLHTTGLMKKKRKFVYFRR